MFRCHEDLKKLKEKKNANFVYSVDSRLLGTRDNGNKINKKKIFCEIAFFFKFNERKSQ